MAILEKFGTIYLDGIPVPPGTVLTKCDSNNPPKIELGDTVPGMEIGWVFVDDRLIADDNILLNVSWDILSASGLTMGKDIQIDGDACRVRCLLEDKNGGSDWDDMLDASEDNNIIHWSGTYSLGTSVLSPRSKQALIWGCAEKDTVEMTDSAYQHIGFGWRQSWSKKVCWNARRQTCWPARCCYTGRMELSSLGWSPRHLSTMSFWRPQYPGKCLLPAPETGVLQSTG